MNVIDSIKEKMAVRLARRAILAHGIRAAERQLRAAGLSKKQAKDLIHVAKMGAQQ